MHSHNMNYSSVLETFKIEHNACPSVKDEVYPKVKDSDNDRKTIPWSLIFKCCIVSSCGSRGPLNYILREDPVFHMRLWTLTLAIVIVEKVEG